MPEKLWLSLKPKTISDIAKSDSPALSIISKDFGVDTARAIVIIALTDLANYFNVGNNFNGQQLAQTAELIIDRFYWLKPDDFKLAFDKAKQAQYGISYNRIDGAVIFEWMEKYIQERAEYFAHENSKTAELPAIRTNDTKKMLDIYRMALTEELNRQATNERKEELRSEAIQAWHQEYQDHFNGIEITEDLHEAYIAKSPLSEAYIQFYIKKNL